MMIFARTPHCSQHSNNGWTTTGKTSWARWKGRGREKGASKGWAVIGPCRASSRSTPPPSKAEVQAPARK
eukprot:11599591-Alexandrium_andersonii.AAC.1